MSFQLNCRNNCGCLLFAEIFLCKTTQLKDDVCDDNCDDDEEDNDSEMKTFITGSEVSQPEVTNDDIGWCPSDIL